MVDRVSVKSGTCEHTETLLLPGPSSTVKVSYCSTPSKEFSFVKCADASSGDFRMSESGRRLVKVPGPKSTNSHSLKMKDPTSTCSVSISLEKSIKKKKHANSEGPTNSDLLKKNISDNLSPLPSNSNDTAPCVSFSTTSSIKM